MYIYFTVEETENTEMTMWSMKVTRLVNRGSEIWNQVCLTSEVML